MGCGSSKVVTAKEVRNDDPPIDSISVPDIDIAYPKPAPPPNSKSDIYIASDYAAIDARVRQQLHQINTSTYEILINTLTSGCTSDLQKVRAIFVWLYLQDIHGAFYSQVTNPHTPRGFMKLIKTRNGSYASFFAQLCRSAGIPCNVIRGIGKGDNYVIGQQDTTTRMESAWNAVYVAGGWRLVHPLWSFFQEKQNFENGIRPPAGTKRTNIQEFFWLADPDRFICFCKPLTDEWQLLKTRCEQKKFLKIPQFTEDYFESGLMLSKKYNAFMKNEVGVFVLEFDKVTDEDKPVEAHVKFETEMSSDVLPMDVDLKDYVAIAKAPKKKTLAFRFPVRGFYTLDVFGGLDSRKPKIVRLLVECKRVGNQPLPFPFNPQEGFGIMLVSSQYGISNADPDTGIILVRPHQQRQFFFSCTNKLEAQAILNHVKHEQNQFADCVSTRSTDSQLQVSVTVPYDDHLEFGLKIAVRPENKSENFQVVANYLLVDENWQKVVATVSPSKIKEESLREELIAATNQNDITRLENAIGNFESHGLEDNGDLTRAKDKLVQLHLDNLTKTTKERKLEELEAAIDLAHKSHVASELKDSQELADAEMTRKQLTRMKLYLHKVLALNKSTIAELHSYQRPRPLVHQVMKATFRILGEPNSKLQNWSYVQASMRQLGRNNMLARMQRCDVINLKPRQVDDAESYLEETNKRSVRMCSAGAGTFFVWSNNMISEYQGKNDKESPSARKVNKNRDNGHSNSSYKSTQFETPRNQTKSR